MSVRWAESGGQYHENTATPSGLYGSGSNPSMVSNLPARNGSTYSVGGQNSVFLTPNIGGIGGFSGLIAGGAFYPAASYNISSFALITFLDNNNVEQCSLRMNTGGQFFFSRNGTNLGAGNPTVSANSLPLNAWAYIEFKALFATGATGTCEVRVNGAVWLTLTSVQNATTNAAGWSAKFANPNVGGVGWMDLYLLDTANTTITGDNTYLGDITVAEIYPNGAGANSAWATGEATTLVSIAASGAASFTLTSVAAPSGGAQVYTGTITGGAGITNAYQGLYFTVTGFTNTNNNGTFLCSASTATTLTLVNTAGGAETHAATATFQAQVQCGIHGGVVDGYATTNVGTRPLGDNLYIYDSNVNDKTDFAHQALALTGSIFAVIHRTYARKDDAGVRQIAQICESPYASSPSEEIGSTISLGVTYQYYDDILEVDPHTSAAWTLSGFNAASFGVKEIA